jgi:hypothetical protein
MDQTEKAHAAVVVLPTTAIDEVLEELGRIAGCKLYRCSKPIKVGVKRQKNKLALSENIRCAFARKVRSVKDDRRSRVPRPHTNRANECPFRVRFRRLQYCGCVH